MSLNAMMNPLEGTPHQRDAIIGGTFTITAAGAISSQDAVGVSGAVVTKDVTGGAVGRYLVTFGRSYIRFRTKGVNWDGPSAGSAFPTTTGGDPQFRPTTDGGKSTLSIQFLRADTQADADPASGTICSWWALVSNAT
jgi:hypothetical protein